mgnify:CR=1 FL=1
MNGLGRICSQKNILLFLYITIFLLPISPVGLYVPLIFAILLSLGHRISEKRQIWSFGPLKWPAAGFLICSFLSVFASVDIRFSLFNWIFLPLMYAALYVLVLSHIRTETERKSALIVFLSGALCVILWGVFQYTDIGMMAKDLNAQAWVDPERFPLLKRRMFSTLENPNLFGAYLLMVISVVISCLLPEADRKTKVLFAVALLVLLICLALTYSRGSWLSMAVILAGLAFFYDKRFGLVFLLILVILFFYHGQISERFISLFSGEDTSVLLRFALWESTEAMIAEHPFLGIGWGSYWLTYPEYNFFIQEPGVIIFHAHDMYLHIFAETGIFGGLFFFTFFFGHAYLSWTLWKTGTGLSKMLGLAGILICLSAAADGIGDYPLFSRSVSFCYWFLSALCISPHLNREKTGTVPNSYKN